MYIICKHLSDNEQLTWHVIDVKEHYRGPEMYSKYAKARFCDIFVLGQNLTSGVEILPYYTKQHNYLD
jgi:hypothetical protein